MVYTLYILILFEWQFAYSAKIGLQAAFAKSQDRGNLNTAIEIPPNKQSHRSISE
jgi:hypothetical protein